MGGTCLTIPSARRPRQRQRARQSRVDCATRSTMTRLRAPSASSGDTCARAASHTRRSKGRRGASRVPRSSAPSGGPYRGPPCSSRRGSFGERARAEDPRDLLGVQRLALEQRAGERVQLLDVLLEDLPRAGGALDDDPLDLAVDGERGLLAVVLGARDLAAQEDVLLVLAEGERAELVGHTPLADHLAGHLRRLLEVVA